MYCTLDDIKTSITEEIIIQLTDDDNVGVINMENFNKAIGKADTEVDGYCATKYAVPFVVVPPIVNTLSTEISIYYLYKRRTVPEEVAKAYDRAISRLKDIARGTLSLGIDPPPAASSSGGAECNKPVSDRVFTRGSMRGF